MAHAEMCGWSWVHRHVTISHLSATYAVSSLDDDDAIIKAFPSSNAKHFVPTSACELEINWVHCVGKLLQSATILWTWFNSLPPVLRDPDISLLHFRQLLKTFYLSHCYTIAWDRLSNQFFLSVYVCMYVCMYVSVCEIGKYFWGGH